MDPRHKRPRGVTVRKVVMVLLACLSVLGGALAGAGASGVRVYRPAKTVCVGSPIKVGVRFTGTGKARWFRITIVDPAQKRVFSKKGSASKKWRYWEYATKRAGQYKVRYRTPRGRRNFSTNANACASPAPTPPTSPPPSSPPTSPPSGGITLSDNDSGGAMFSLSNARPGDTDMSCIVVSYAGSPVGTVRLYGTTSGTGLDQYVTLTVTRGASSSGFDSCTDFVPDQADYVGEGSGVIYHGSLAGYGDSYDSGLVDPTPSVPESWEQGEAHAYQFTITINDDNLAQGKNATQEFIWEARTP
jgi:hypothetical protein